MILHALLIQAVARWREGRCAVLGMGAGAAIVVRKAACGDGRVEYLSADNAHMVVASRKRDGVAKTSLQIVAPAVFAFSQNTAHGTSGC